MCVAYTLKVSPTGFGYPLGDLSDSNPGKRISAPNALGVHPPELSSSPVIERSSRISLSALALSYKTLPGLVPTLQRLPPTGKAVLLLLLAEGLIRPGAFALLSFPAS